MSASTQPLAGLAPGLRALSTARRNPQRSHYARAGTGHRTPGSGCRCRPSEPGRRIRNLESGHPVPGKIARRELVLSPSIADDLHAWLV
jgi:hypothetical protein